MIKIALVSALIAFGGLSVSKCTYNATMTPTIIEAR